MDEAWASVVVRACGDNEKGDCETCLRARANSVKRKPSVSTEWISIGGKVGEEVNVLVRVPRITLCPERPSDRNTSDGRGNHN